MNTTERIYQLLERIEESILLIQSQMGRMTFLLCLSKCVR